VIFKTDLSRRRRSFRFNGIDKFGDIVLDGTDPNRVRRVASPVAF
jgi:hypothetical protein